MAQQLINLGATGSGAGGDSARTAFEKIIANFGELYPAALPGTAAQKQAARDMFGLGTAATKAAQTGPTDPTAGALMAVGAFGLGASFFSGSAYITDADALTVTGDYPVGATWVGSPFTGTNGINQGSIRHTANFQNTSYAKQEWTSLTLTTPRKMVRNKVAGTWGLWREVFHTGNILGTVSQSSGVPTGAIIERGSNANGEYVRFADGTQIARFASADITSVDVASGSLYISSSVIGWNYPAPFADIPSVSVNARYISGPNTAAWAQGNTATASQAVSRVASGVPIAACQFKILFTAIGRWY